MPYRYAMALKANVLNATHEIEEFSIDPIAHTATIGEVEVGMTDLRDILAGKLFTTAPDPTGPTLSRIGEMLWIRLGDVHKGFLISELSEAMIQLESSAPPDFHRQVIKSLTGHFRFALFARSAEKIGVALVEVDDRNQQKAQAQKQLTMETVEAWISERGEPLPLEDEPIPLSRQGPITTITWRGNAIEFSTGHLIRLLNANTFTWATCPAPDHLREGS